MSTSVPPELMAHHCGRCGMWHHGSLCPDMRQQPLTVIQGVDPQEHVSVTMERNVLRDQLAQAEADRDRFRTALAEIAALPRPQLQSERTWREVALEALWRPCAMAESGLGHNKRSDREVAWREGDRVETPSGIGRVVDPNYPIGAAGATICPTRVQVALESGLVLFDDDQLTRIEG